MIPHLCLEFALILGVFTAVLGGQVEQLDHVDQDFELIYLTKLARAGGQVRCKRPPDCTSNYWPLTQGATGFFLNFHKNGLIFDWVAYPRDDTYGIIWLSWQQYSTLKIIGRTRF